MTTANADHDHEHDEFDRGPAHDLQTMMNRRRATERFHRADPARSRHRGGSGLGLSIVDAAVAAHGGTVTIDSAPDRGTTVCLTFPAVPADGTDDAESSVTEAIGNPVDRRKDERLA